MSLGIIAAFAYGLLALVGGIIGYIQANSLVSLLSGSISGLLLILAAYLQFQGLTWGLVLAALITIGLVIFFSLRLFKTRKFMPAGLMVILGILALIVMINTLISSQ